MSGTLVVKIGGSTLGAADSTFEDVARLQRDGRRVAVIHGGGAAVTRWLKRLDMPTRFVRGLRVTDEDSIDVVVAVLGGLVNKQIVAAIGAAGGRALGLSGADAGILSARIADPELGLVGEIVAVDTSALEALLAAGIVPVVAPLGIADGRIVNINADTAAGHIAAALGAESLVFLTDVEGVLDADKRLVERMSPDQALGLIASGAADGGMIPKLESAVTAVRAGAVCRVVDGRKPGALLAAASGSDGGTTVIPAKS